MEKVPFKCKLKIRVEFLNEFKNSKVWWTTEPLGDGEFDKLDGWGTWRWLHGHRSLIIEFIGVYDANWIEGKPNFNDLLMFLDAEWRQGEAKYWNLVEEAIIDHRKKHPEQFT